MEATTMFRFFSAVMVNPKPHKLFSSLSIFPSATAPRHFQSLKFPTKQNAHSENRDIGDRVVFDDGIFESGAVFQNDSNLTTNTPKRRPSPRTKVTRITRENLVPDKWREVQSETKITINERRKKKKNIRGLVPLRDANKIEVEKKLSRYKDVNWDEYKSSKKAKLRQISPLVLKNPSTFHVKAKLPEPDFNSERVEPKDPRGFLHGKGLEDVMQFFIVGAITLVLRPLIKGKWLPQHTVAACGELYLLDSWLKHNADINSVDKDGLTALHKAIGKKQVITNFLLKNSANVFVRDKEGATLMHYAVQTASTETIELLLLYIVEINLQDNDGWTPLNLAVQTPTKFS